MSMSTKEILAIGRGVLRESEMRDRLDKLVKENRRHAGLLAWGVGGERGLKTVTITIPLGDYLALNPAGLAKPLTFEHEGKRWIVMNYPACDIGYVGNELVRVQASTEAVEMPLPAEVL